LEEKTLEKNLQKAFYKKNCNLRVYQRTFCKNILKRKFWQMDDAIAHATQPHALLEGK
jgi:hypothetical protein